MFYSANRVNGGIRGQMPEVRPGQTLVKASAVIVLF